MSKRILSLSLSLLILLSSPGQAFLSGFGAGAKEEKSSDKKPGLWDSFVSGAKDALKEAFLIEVLTPDLIALLRSAFALLTKILFFADLILAKIYTS